MHSENWDDLRFFLAVAAHGSMSGAARALGVNQSTVHRRVAQLEGRLGARLFERRTQGAALTAAGERMLPRARQVAEEVDALRRSVRGADAALTGTIRVTTVLELFQVLAPWFAAFREAYPRIELTVLTDPRVLSLQRNEADIALRPGAPPTEPEVVGRRLVPLGLAVYGSPAYLERRGRPTSVEALTGHDWVAFLSAGGRSVAAPGGARVVAQVDSRLGQQAAVRAGIGLATLPVFMAEQAAGLERLFDVPVDGLFLWLLFHRELRQTARLRAFVHFLQARVAEAGPNWA